MAVILNGKALSERFRKELKRQYREQHAAGLPTPFLTAVQVGEDLPSTVYIRAKQRACEELGFGFEHRRLPGVSSMEELHRVVDELNRNGDVHGLIVQSPLPRQIDEIKVQGWISPAKDVDCFHPENVGRLYIGKPRFLPGTASGIIELMLAYGFSPAGKRAVIIGRSVIVGRPLALMMMLKGRGGDATVTVCHSRTPDLPGVCREADVLVPAVGVARMVKGNWVKPGAVVVDVGINRVPDETRKRGYRLEGDVAFDEVEPKAAAIAPVPGGVGPMTVAILMSNLMRAAGYQLESWDRFRLAKGDDG